jgi:acyl transferase domain-containing protein
MKSDIAIIGMACRFPGSPDLRGFWRTVRTGRICFREVPPERWDLDLFHSSNPKDSDKTLGRKMGALDDVRSFAPEFFGMVGNGVTVRSRFCANCCAKPSHPPSGSVPSWA